MTADAMMVDGALAIARERKDLLEAVVHEHSRLAYRIAYSVLRNPPDAEDAVQETFLRVLRQSTKIAQIQDHKAWVAQIAWRVAVERRKAAMRLGLSTGASRNPPVERDESVAELASRERAADQMLIDNERNELLQQLIGALPDRLRDPLVLSALEELSPREVGAMLAISEAAVRSRSFRARQIIRERLQARLGKRP